MQGTGFRWALGPFPELVSVLAGGYESSNTPRRVIGTGKLLFLKHSE